MGYLARHDWRSCYRRWLGYMTGRLSKNFRKDELDCPDCGKCKIASRLVKALQKLRDLVEKPIIVNSGYRCPEYNKKIGGVSNSQHVAGNAADIVIRGMNPEEMYKQAVKIQEFREGGIGIYIDRGFIHVDVRAGSARWAEKDGRRVRYFDKSKEPVR